MDPELQKTRNEDCRREVLAYLAPRQEIAQAVSTIHRRVNRDGNDFTMREVESALAFLKSAGWIQKVNSKFGSSCYYQATSEGVLAYERGD